MTEPPYPPPPRVPAFVLVTGPEELLAERAIAATVTELRDADPAMETIRVEADRYETGELRRHTEPSLFGGAKCLIVTGLERSGDDLVADLMTALGDPAPEVTVVAWHAGGARARKVLEGFRAAKARVVTADAVKTDRDKHDFVVHEFRQARRKISPGAVRALQEAVGRDLRELAAACHAYRV